jgi:hypothetical protein
MRGAKAAGFSAAPAGSDARGLSADAPRSAPFIAIGHQPGVRIGKSVDAGSQDPRHASHLDAQIRAADCLQPAVTGVRYAALRDDV